ncbi:LacI family DNA-binding transcriptional regulator [Curtobacterium flaccumfaciens]|nr:LacI family DNA-binding transcriptional regulator [Curtobacterium flaccumfaciens]
MAALAGVSIGTASKALNGTGQLRDATRLRVKEAAEKLGFVGDARARAVLGADLHRRHDHHRLVRPVLYPGAARCRGRPVRRADGRPAVRHPRRPRTRGPLPALPGGPAVSTASS